MPRILITGGSGFIGTNLVDSYLQDGWTVVNFDFSEPRNPAHRGLFQPGDIRDRDVLQKAFAQFRPEYVVHLAARADLDGKSLHEYDANTIGVQNMIDAIQSVGTVRRVIFASTRYVHRTEIFPEREDDYSPFTLYGESKVQSEKIVRTANMQCTWLLIRPTSIWGPWFRMPYRTFFDTVRRGVYLHPKNTKISKSYGYVGNVVFQIKKLLEAPCNAVHGRTFYVSDDYNMDVFEFAQTIQKSFGARPVKNVPLQVLKALAFAGDALKVAGMVNPPLTSFRLNNLLAQMHYDMSATRAVTGAAPYSLSEGVKTTTEWILQHG